MAYVPAQLNLMSPRLGTGGMAMWLLHGTDIHTDVDAADFISDGDAKGLKVSDVLIYVKTTATVGATLHSVSVVTAGGAATVTPAILA
jgi:hypothetical protein